MLKKALKLAGLGFLIGVAVNSLISAVIGHAVSQELIERAGSERAAMLLELVLVGLYGAVCMGSVILYDLDRLPMALMMFCHYAVCIGPFVPLSLGLSWFRGAAEIGIALACQTAGYFAVWLILDLKY